MDKELLKSEAGQRLSSLDRYFQTSNSPFGSPDSFNRLFKKSTIPSSSIVPVQPLRMSERVTVQQGLFLYPASIFDFELTLKLTMRSWCERLSIEPCGDWIYKVVIEPGAEASSIEGVESNECHLRLVVPRPRRIRTITSHQRADKG